MRGSSKDWKHGSIKPLDRVALKPSLRMPEARQHTYVYVSLRQRLSKHTSDGILTRRYRLSQRMPYAAAYAVGQTKPLVVLN